MRWRSIKGERMKARGAWRSPRITVVRNQRCVYKEIYLGHAEVVAAYCRRKTSNLCAFPVPWKHVWAQVIPPLLHSTGASYMARGPIGQDQWIRMWNSRWQRFSWLEAQQKFITVSHISKIPIISVVTSQWKCTRRENGRDSFMTPTWPIGFSSNADENIIQWNNFGSLFCRRLRVRTLLATLALLRPAGNS